MLRGLGKRLVLLSTTSGGCTSFSYFGDYKRWLRIGNAKWVKGYAVMSLGKAVECFKNTMVEDDAGCVIWLVRVGAV